MWPLDEHISKTCNFKNIMNYRLDIGGIDSNYMHTNVSVKENSAFKL